MATTHTDVVADNENGIAHLLLAENNLYTPDIKTFY